MNCQLAGVCGGCPLIQVPIEKQREMKLQEIASYFPKDEVKILSPGTSRLRDRVDLTIRRQNGQLQLGLWSLDTSGEALSLGERQLVDIPSCPMMTPELEAWFQDFRSHLPHVDLGSVRLRVSPTGKRGVWLDFSNEDVKNLFEEKEYLKWLHSQAVVEIGQKKKRLYFEITAEGERPRLKKESELDPWFQTWDLAGRSHPVYGAIGGFSQSGLQANKMLVTEVMEKCKQMSLPFWLEAFCGSGNFTYPLAQQSQKILAFENDPMALESLKKGLAAEHIQHVSLMSVDLKSKRQMEALIERLPSDGKYGLLADPPRSGLMRLIQLIEEKVLYPEALVYVSCSTKSWLKDAQSLKNQNYRLLSLSLVDQFPHSRHVEWVSLWSRILA